MQPSDKVKELSKQIDTLIEDYMNDQEFDEELIELAERALEAINNGNNNITDIR